MAVLQVVPGRVVDYFHAACALFLIVGRFTRMINEKKKKQNGLVWSGLSTTRFHLWSVWSGLDGNAVAYGLGQNGPSLLPGTVCRVVLFDSAWLVTHNVVGVWFRYPKSAYIIAKHVLHLHCGCHQGQDKPNARHRHLHPSTYLIDYREITRLSFLCPAIDVKCLMPSMQLSRACTGS